MTDYTLKRSEKNAVLNFVTEGGLDPLAFQWSEKKRWETFGLEGVQVMVSILTHGSTGYYIVFGAASVEYSPGHQKKVEWHEHYNEWASKGETCRLWIKVLRKELDAPDLWASIGQEKALSTAASSAHLDNRPFTAAEQTLIAAKLDEIKGYILEEQQLTADQGETVERELAYLWESSERLGRKDWLNVLLGALVSLAIGLALDSEKARGLLRLAGAVFQSLWRTGHSLLP